MIDFSRAKLTDLAIHFVGNKSLSEELSYGEKTIHFKDDFVKNTLLSYFLSPFKTDIFYEFKTNQQPLFDSLETICSDLFDSQKQFLEKSKQAALLLFNKGNHPKIIGGEFYMCYFKDTLIDGLVCDAIGIFKTETKEPYLKVFQHIDEFDIDCEYGININKLDKGCLIFNTEKQNGYKLSIVDINNKNAAIALYWEEDFINAKLKLNGYYHTKNFIDASRGFCEEILTEANNVKKEDQLMMLNKSTSYFKEKDSFNLKDFEKEVLVQPDLIEAFQGYRKDYCKRLDLTAIDEFDVSKTAVKKNQKYMRSVVKLDKNFHIYIHAKHENVERGFDEEKGLKYYKLFYVNEA